MNKGIDDYIASAQPFARPVLKKLRTIIHSLGVEIDETIKWGSPVFVCHGNLCMAWAFKEHAAIHFFKGALIQDDFNVMAEENKDNVSSRSIRFTNVGEIDEAIIRNYLLQAIEINKLGIKPAARKKPPLVIPEEFLTILKKNKAELNQFLSLPPSHQRQYTEYYMEAKKAETKLRRMERILESLRNSKSIW